MSVVTSEPTPTAPSLAENGQRVPLTGAENLGRAKSVVLAIDRSQSMTGGPLANAIAAARAFIAAKPVSDRVAVATFATEPLLLTDFSIRAQRRRRRARVDQGRPGAGDDAVRQRSSSAASRL